MIKEIQDKHAIQQCGCGAENKINFYSIRIKKSGDARTMTLPACPVCKTRIEFILVGKNMTEMESKLYCEMALRGIHEPV